MGLTFSRDGKTAETGTMNLTNLLPENIRQGVNIAGVVGTYIPTLKKITLEIPYSSGSLYAGSTKLIAQLPKGRILSITPTRTPDFIIGNGIKSMYKYNKESGIGILSIGEIYLKLRVRNQTETKEIFDFDHGHISLDNHYNTRWIRNTIRLINLFDKRIDYYFSITSQNDEHNSGHSNTSIYENTDNLWQHTNVLELYAHRKIGSYGGEADEPNLTDRYNWFRDTYKSVAYTINYNLLDIVYLG